MIPMFKAKEEECMAKYEKIISVRNQLYEFKDEFGIKKQLKIQPSASTSFMVRKTKLNI